MNPWESPRWPEDVAYRISGYERPLFSLIDDAAREYPNSVYTLFNGAGNTFLQVKERADRLAAFLVDRGIRPGDRVAVFLPNVPHYPEVFFGILKAGSVCVTCNPMYQAAELNFQLADCGAKAAFVLSHPTLYPSAVAALKDTQVETVVVCTIRSYLPRIKGFLGGVLGKVPRAPRLDPEHLLFDSVLRSSPSKPPQVAVNPTGDCAVILYTGGTTGVPKGACLSHANLMSNVMAFDEWVRIEEIPGEPPRRPEKGGAHTSLGVLPWYHSFGLTLCLLSSCRSGSRVVCIPDPRAGDPPFTEMLKAIEDCRATTMAAVPTIFSAMVHHPRIGSFDLSSLIGCASGAAPMPLEVLRRFEEQTGAVIFEGYGLTETAPVLTMNPSTRDGRKIGSVGLPAPNTDIRILDAETGTRELPQGQDGEIAASGPQIMLGYWNRPDENEPVFREFEGKRFFLTGDVGHLDGEGFLFITDRKKDLIIVGGFNVYPREVEEVLYGHPEVALAAVIGVPDNRTGESVKAFVQLRPGARATEEDLLDFCKARVAGYKRPRHVEIRSGLPVSVVGKVLRRKLREEERERSV